MNATMPSHDYGGVNNTGTGAITNAATIVKILKGAWDKSQNISYQPAELIAKEGSTIIWINQDSVMHIVAG